MEHILENDFKNIKKINVLKFFVQKPFTAFQQKCFIQHFLLEDNGVIFIQKKMLNIYKRERMT